MRSAKTISYIEAVKNKPGLLFHVGLFLVMVLLSIGVWRSLETVFPDGAELGKFAIVGRIGCILLLIAIAVRASSKTVKRALILIVIATALEAAEFGCHWMYARELSSSRMAQAEIDRQKVLDDGLADKNAQRSTQVLDSLTKFNASQSKLSQSDRDYFRSTGIRRNRKTTDAPSLDQLGIVTNVQPTPQPTQVPAMVNGLNSSVTKNSKIEQPDVPLSELQVLARWTPRFVLAAILALGLVFVGTGVVIASWEWDMDGNGIADSLEGKA